MRKSSLSLNKALPTTTRGVATCFTFGVLLLGFNAFILYRNVDILRHHQNRLKHATDLLEAVDDVMSAMKDAETGQRGYQITGKESYLEPFHAARGTVANRSTALRRLVADQPQNLQRLDELSAVIKEKFNWMDFAIEERRSKGLEASLAIYKGRGKELMDAIRAIVQRMRSEEETVRTQIEAEVADSVTALDRSFVFVTIANLVLACLCYYFVRRSILQQVEKAARQADEAWLHSGLASVSDALLGDFDLKPLCAKAVSIISAYLGVPLLNLYTNRQRSLYLQGSLTNPPDAPTMLAYGSGLTGAAAAEGRTIHLTDVPRDYFRIASSTGSAAPSHLVVVPLLYQNMVKGVLEVASFKPFSPVALALLEALAATLATSIDAAESRSQLQELLEETQRQAEELQSQQEELRVGNEELEQQAQALKQVRDNLQAQQEQLHQTNEELEQQARALEAQKGSLVAKNTELETARRETEVKAKELEVSGRYKSEFLANMSHELRTPLNSLLILSTLLAENQKGHLDDKEVEFSRTIHRAGADLLNLINDILDLSKVEAGKLDLHPEQMAIADLVGNLRATFAPMAAAKSLAFSISVAAGTPATIVTDSQRLEQILRNFLSNAIKFTLDGSVGLQVKAVDDPRGALAFSVEDTGIGIAPDNMQAIFDSFQQADGSTSRVFGGTGLGLTISRELAALLGGTIEAASQQGRGSVFTLYMPAAAGLSGRQQDLQPVRISSPAPQPVTSEADPNSNPTPPRIRGDTADLKATDRIILIIEDDPVFAETLVELAHESGFKALCVGDGESALELLDRHAVHGVILDVKLPDVSGLSILERIKHNPKTRHLPIHVISGTDHVRNALQLGAIGYLVKPASLDDLRQSFVRIEQMIAKRVKKVLIVEDDSVQRQAVAYLIGGHDIETLGVGSGAEALQALAREPFDCMILDLTLPDISGFELLERIEAAEALARPPVVIYTGKDLSKAEVTRLQHYSESIVIKGARSPERLLDEVSLFLHRVEADMPQDHQAMLQTMREKEKIFAGKKVLVVDDDMRNVFALANALERSGLKVVVGRDGNEALSKLAADPDIALVLMDIMMPHLDGLEAMRRIRTELKRKKLPIIALTAKAMRGDHEKCLEAGASDYLPKPVDLERLLSLMRVWLPQGGSL